MKTLAAVLVELGQPLQLIELEIPPLKPGQALVEIAFSGVCHTQLLESRGYRGEDSYLPHCLGHEGSGVVVETGSGVSRCAAGDSVVLSWIKAQGMDVPGSVYTSEIGSVNAGGVTTFAKHAVVSENRVTRIEPNSPSMSLAALMGCAAPTGVGAVWNTAGVACGESVVVMGVGGVGLCAVAAAAQRGASQVIAVDVRPQRLELARQLGASELVDASRDDPLIRIRQLCPRGADYAIEASGRPEVMRQAVLQSVRSQGGKAVVIGNARYGERLEIDPGELNQGKQLLGAWGGDCVPDRDYPKLAELLTSGDLNLRALVGNSYSLAQINEALDDLERGDAARPMIDMRREC